MLVHTRSSYGEKKRLLSVPRKPREWCPAAFSSPSLRRLLLRGGELGIIGGAQRKLLLQIPVIVTHGIQLHPISHNDGEDSRVRVPLERQVLRSLWLVLGDLERELPVSEPVSLEEDDIDTLIRPRKTLDASHQVTLRPPAETALQTIDRLADAVQLAIAVVHADYSPPAALLREEVDSDIGAVAPPADAAFLEVVVGAESALVHLLRDGRVAERLGLGAPALELRLLLTPSDGDVLGEPEVVLGHGGGGDDVEGAAHEEDFGVAGGYDEEFLVGRPASAGDGRLEGADYLDVSLTFTAVVVPLGLGDGDNVTAGHDDASGEGVGEVVQTLDDVWLFAILSEDGRGIP